MSDVDYDEEYLDSDHSSDEGHDGDRNTSQRKEFGKKSCDDAKFVDLLVSYGKVLLEKSQAPPIKLKKKTAAKEMCVQLLVQHGIDMLPAQIMKKINNMKARIKAKTDRKQTGNRKINLKESERKFFDLMGGVENPSVSKRPYGIAIGSSVRNGRADQETASVETQEGNVSEEEAFDDEFLNTSTNQGVQQRCSQQNVNQKTIMEEQLKLIKAQQAYTAQLQAQQDERHQKEMEVLVLKRKLTLLKIQQIETAQLFLAIWWPLKLQITKRRARFMIVCIWIIALSSTIPWALFFELVPIFPEAPEIQLCVEVWPPGTDGALYFLLANLVACYLLPMVLITICYILIWIKVWRRSIPGDSKDAQMDRMQQKSKIKVVKMLVVVVILFVLSWLPLYVIFARIKLGGALESNEEELLQIATPIAQWLGASNSCINPILYAFFNKKYRKGFVAIIRSRKCCGRLRYYETVAIASSSTSTRKSSHYHNSSKRTPHSPSMKSADAVSYIYEEKGGRRHHAISKQDSNLSRHMLLKQDSSISRQTLLKQDSIASRSAILYRQDSDNSRQMLLKQDSNGSRDMLSKQSSASDSISRQDSQISYIEPRKGILCKQDTQISYIEHSSASKKYSASLSSQDSVLSIIEHKRHRLVKQDSIFSFNEPKSVYENAAVAPPNKRHQLVKQHSVISFADQKRGGSLTKQDSVTTIHRAGNGDGPYISSILKKTDSQCSSASPIRKNIGFFDG